MESFDPSVPLYQQIIAMMKRDIVSAVYGPGAKIPSIRELAIQYQVTPNTIQRALQILEQQKLINTERTNGKYITKDADLIGALRREILESRVQMLLSELAEHGYSMGEIKECLDREVCHYEDSSDTEN